MHVRLTNSTPDFLRRLQLLTNGTRDVEEMGRGGVLNSQKTAMCWQENGAVVIKYKGV